MHVLKIPAMQCTTAMLSFANADYAKMLKAFLTSLEPILQTDDADRTRDGARSEHLCSSKAVEKHVLLGISGHIRMSSHLF